MNLDNLPVSIYLKVRLQLWCQWYEKNSYWRKNFNKKSFDIRKFSKEGLEIAKEIKKELPDWKVIYFDDSKYKYYHLRLTKRKKKPRSKYVYEII